MLRIVLHSMKVSVVGVAQLVERQIVVLNVAGSIPVAHPIAVLVEIEKISRGVAQLVAHSLWERGVASSSLATPTILSLLGTSNFLSFCERP